VTIPVRHVSRPVARRFLVLRHLLAPPRGLPAEPSSVMTVVDRLGSLQFDPIDVAGRNHDLTLLARIAGYRREWTDGLLYGTRDLYETYNKQLSIVPTAELPWYRVTWDRNRVAHEGAAFDEHAPLVEELLARIRADGALSSTDVGPRAVIEWYWRPTNQVRALLEALGEAGILGIARRDGNRRVYDLAERLFPRELLERRPSVDEQQRHRLLSRYRGNGLLGATGEQTIFAGIGHAPARSAYRQQLEDAGELVPVEVEGFRGPRYVVTDELPILDAAAAEVDGEGEPEGLRVARPGGREPGVAFLAPLDPIAWDRDLLLRLWDFDYRWEVYVPGPKRRWGYYVLPLLHGDRLVGRIELRADRPAKTLRVLGLWWEHGFDPLDEADPGFVDAMAEALAAHLAFTGLSRLSLPRTGVHRGLARGLRERLAATVRPGVAVPTPAARGVAAARAEPGRLLESAR
jgi:uncharacterized protein